MSEICYICKELEIGLFPVCNVCAYKMMWIIDCKTVEQAEAILKMMKEYPTSKSCLVKQ